MGGVCMCVCSSAYLKILSVGFFSLDPLSLLPLIRTVNEKYIALQTRLMVLVLRVVF